jgi:NADPH-dependent glutamate synthase beta subunit-like oxidoreductase
VDFRMSGDVLHEVRNVLQDRKGAGLSDTDVEQLAAGITKGVDDFLNSHRNVDFTLEQVLDTVDSRLRMAGTIAPDIDEAKLDAVHDATDAATRYAVERMNT